MPLRPHQLRAGQPELYSGEGVDGIVNAAVAGDKAAQHLAVCGVDNGIAFQRGNVATPEVHPLPHRRQVLNVRDPLLPGFLSQVCILNLKKLLAHRLRHPDVQQGSEQVLLLLNVLRQFHAIIFRPLPEQRLN